MVSFASRLVAWQREHGRHDLPWQGADTYCVWLSEIMLQQTQVTTVVPYYLRFVAAFPTVTTLAAAHEDEVLAHWSGLGYYARGRNLHKAAKIVVEKHGGRFPRCFEDILALPGVGRTTAAAICALAFHERRTILDGNVKRVMARHRGIEGWAGSREIEAQLWRQAEALLPRGGIAVYIQALMDLGATVCTRSRPKCGECPVREDCIAHGTARTGELPVPRPKKNMQERQAIFLLPVHGNDILLEKRPGKGLWGGLWCPLQFDNEAAARTWFMHSGMVASEGERLEPFVHAFTHFRLHIAPLKILVMRKPARTLPPGGAWLDVEDALRSAVPAPLRYLLESMRSPAGKAGRS